MKVVLIGLILIVLGGAFEVTSAPCINIPNDHMYYLTTFCNQKTACGGSCGNCNWFYASDAQRFKCGTTINCNRAGKYANLEIIDEGPDCDL